MSSNSTPSTHKFLRVVCEDDPEQLGAIIADCICSILVEFLEKVYYAITMLIYERVFHDRSQLGSPVVWEVDVAASSVRIQPRRAGFDARLSDTFFVQDQIEPKVC